MFDYSDKSHLSLVVIIIQDPYRLSYVAIVHNNVTQYSNILCNSIKLKYTVDKNEIASF